MEKKLYETCQEEPKYELKLNIKNKVSPLKETNQLSKEKLSREESDYEEH
jgi:hypothetical protein